MKTTMTTLVFALTLVSSAAFASRYSESAKSEFDGAIKADKDAMTKSCGCAPKFNINWAQFKTEDDSKVPVQGVDEVTKAFESICKKPADGKAVCGAVKTVSVNLGESTAPTLTGGTLTVTRKYNLGYGDVADVITKEIDK